MVDTSIQDMKGYHSHCILCRQVNCEQFVDNVTACEMSTCPYCNWRFHACKSEEHAITCQESRVPCVNASNGCPHTIKRSQMAQHLPVCPASVVSCTEEWCRWPMHAREQGVRHSLPPTKTYLECGQLDVGLAMRDQRMLIDSLKAPRKLKRSLRNPLTQKYPAVPFNHRGSSPHDSDPRASGDTSQTVSDDETDAPWDLNKLQPGLKESIRSQLYQVSKATADQLATALNSTSEVLSNNKNREETGALVSPEGHGETITVNTNCVTDKSKDGENTEKISPARESNKDTIRLSVSSDCISDISRSRSVSVLRDVGGTQLHKITGEKLVDGNDDEISLHKILGVNLTYEVINKYVKKPASMYTFICAQNFRRDEYKWHFKNVHQEIHQGFNGWMEQRCPLAYQGCTFSFQRLIPEQPDVVLYHSWLQESYGLKSLAQPMHLQADRDSELNSLGALDSDTHTKTLSSLDIDEKTDVTANAPEQRQQSSISDLGCFDREFDFVQPPVSSRNSSDGFAHDSSARIKKTESEGDASSLSRSYYSESGRESEERESMMSVRPVVFTACNPDSKVLFQYNVEENQRRINFISLPALTGLPFEILQLIGSHLDSFSLCNLSLTCRRLREVCCSLLDDHGIVLLNWERENTGDKVSWKVSNKRWMFSTSFEPIRKWKFNPNQPSVSDHLKSCPFNQDCNTHSEPIQIIFT